MASISTYLARSRCRHFPSNTEARSSIHKLLHSASNKNNVRLFCEQLVGWLAGEFSFIVVVVVGYRWLALVVSVLKKQNIQLSS